MDGNLRSILWKGSSGPQLWGADIACAKIDAVHLNADGISVLIKEPGRNFQRHIAIDDADKRRAVFTLLHANRGEILQDVLMAHF